MIVLEHFCTFGFVRKYEQCPVCGHPVDYVKAQYENCSIHFRCECLNAYCGWFECVPKSENANKDRKREKDLSTWAFKVKERDRWKCCLCGATENLDAHHFLPKAEYPDYQFDIENGITLCRPCHMKFHPWMKDKGKKKS